MPYQLTWETDGVYRQYVGDVTPAERRESLEIICRDRRFDDLRYTLTDYLSVQRYETDKNDTAEIAALHLAPLRTNPRIVIAAVAQRPDIVSAIRDFIALGFTKAPYEVFDTIEAARHWIASVRR